MLPKLRVFDPLKYIFFYLCAKKLNFYEKKCKTLEIFFHTFSIKLIP